MYQIVKCMCKVLALYLHFWHSHCCLLSLPPPPPRERGVLSRFQEMGWLNWGKKSKPPKKPGPKINPQKTHTEFLNLKNWSTHASQSSLLKTKQLRLCTTVYLSAWHSSSLIFYYLMINWPQLSKPLKNLLNLVRAQKLAINIQTGTLRQSETKRQSEWKIIIL